MEATDEKFKEWCIVELFGHTKIAGVTTEANIGGCQFIRVDVPEIPERKAFTKFYGQGAIYAMSPVTEEICMAFLRNNNSVPVHRYQLQISEQDPEF